LDQACSQDDVKRAPAARTAAPGGDAAQQQQLVRRASKALLKQVEETRRKYTSEVEGLKAELQLLNRQAQKDRREADLASVTAAAAKKAALEATEELERVKDEVLRAKRTVQQLNRSVVVPRAARTTISLSRRLLQRLSPCPVVLCRQRMPQSVMQLVCRSRRHLASV
jgi:hypothetical protein